VLLIIIVTVTKSYSVYIKYYSKQGEKIMVLVRIVIVHGVFMMFSYVFIIIMSYMYYSVQAKYTLLYSKLLYKRVYFAGTE
jgi:uncharacterized membrane protein